MSDDATLDRIRAAIASGIRRGLPPSINDQDTLVDKVKEAVRVLIQQQARIKELESDIRHLAERLAKY